MKIALMKVELHLRKYYVLQAKCPSLLIDHKQGILVQC